ncbi:PspC domain-containing protein [Schleiferia thermophila]|uniref:PspC domain-containing protein n=1 Tax=Schleiferia thermophila TaxID=884107 RepID=UPI003EEC896A
MKKTVSVSINNIQFYLTEQAFACLQQYLDSIKSVLDPEYAEETLQDIEFRIAELLQQELHGREVADDKDILKIKKILGSPSDFDTDTANQAEESDTGMVIKKLLRDPEGGIIAGVASGLAHYFSIDVLIVRLLFIVFGFISGTGLIVYLILWLIVPKANSSLDRLKMRGEKITVKKIEEQIRNELKSSDFSVRKISSTKAGKILNDIINLVAQIIRSLIRLGLKLFSILILIIVGILIFALLSVIFSFLSSNNAHISINHFEFNANNLSDVISFYFGSVGTFYWLISFLLLFLVSVGLLFFFVFRSIAKSTFSTYKKYYIFILFSLLLSSAVVTGFIINRVKEYSESSSLVIFSSQINVYEQDTIFILPVLEDEAYKSKFQFGRDSLYLSDVEIHLTKGDAKPIVFIRAEAKGTTKNSAFLRAKNIEYPFQINERFLKLSRYLIVPVTDSYGAQKVSIHLSVPENTVLFLSDVFNYSVNSAIKYKRNSIETGYYKISTDGFERL